MAGMMQANKEYLRLCHGVMRAPLPYVIRKTVVVQTYCDNPWYATPDDKMITRMSHLPQDKNKLYIERQDSSTKEHTPKYKIDDRKVYDILNQTCKDQFS